MLIFLNKVLNSIQTNYSLILIKYWKKFLILICIFKEKIKNNLNYISLLRTHQYLSKRQLDSNEFTDFPKILETDLNIESIKDRIYFNSSTEFISE